MKFLESIPFLSTILKYVPHMVSVSVEVGEGDLTPFSSVSGL